MSYSFFPVSEEAAIEVHSVLPAKHQVKSRSVLRNDPGTISFNVLETII